MIIIPHIYHDNYILKTVLLALPTTNKQLTYHFPEKPPPPLWPPPKEPPEE
jgi:hypothetical protein